MPTAIILWVFAVAFTLATGVCLLDARLVTHGYTDGDIQHTARWFLRGAFADASVVALCILGWYLMQRRLSATLALGAIAVMVAAYIICHRSLIYLIRGASIEYWFDLVLELPFLFYAIIYAYRECRKAAV
jgi:hypothetical protein